MNTSHIDEKSITQPFSANRCWMKIRNVSSSPKVDERFCSKPANKYILTKMAGMRVEMFLCFDHSEKMKKYGYTVTLAK